MRDVLMILMLLLAAVVLTAAALLWHRWTVYIMLSNKTVSLAVSLFGGRKRVFYRDFSVPKKKPEEPPMSAEQAENADPRKDGAQAENEEPPKNQEDAAENQKKKKAKARKNLFSADKKRIYDKDGGGFQMDGFCAVVQEYIGYLKKGREMLHRFLDDTRHKIAILSLSVSLDFGTGNPAYTGMLYGGIWSAVGTGYPLLCRYFVMDYPKLFLTPDYDRARLDFEIKGIIKVRPAQILHAAIKQAAVLAVTYCYKQFKKGSGNHG